VRVLEESLRGADMFKTYNVKQEVIAQSKKMYERLAAYKLA
jgi:hypothetical protein